MKSDLFDTPKTKAAITCEYMKRNYILQSIYKLKSFMLFFIFISEKNKKIKSQQMIYFSYWTKTTLALLHLIPDRVTDLIDDPHQTLGLLAHCCTVANFFTDMSVFAFP